MSIIRLLPFCRPTPRKVIYRHVTYTARHKLYGEIATLAFMLFMFTAVIVVGLSFIHAIDSVHPDFENVSNISMKDGLIATCSIFGIIFAFLVACQVLSVIKNIKHVKKAAEQCSYYEHLITATASSLQDSITALETRKTERQANITALQSTLDHVTREFQKQTKAIRQQIDIEKDIARKDDYDGEIALRQKLLSLRQP